jgi:CelD/BcsL family acetyltransferase involved in cellulose biosynthesis
LANQPHFLFALPRTAPAKRAGQEPAARSSAEIAVSLATSLQEFADLAPEWNRLHDEADAASVFNSWMWLYEWWHTYGKGRRLCILVAREAGATVGVLPLYFDQARALGMPVRLLRFVGTGADTHPDDLGPVLARGRELSAALALARAALRVAGADVWLFSDIDPRSIFPAALEAAAGELGYAAARGGGERIALVELPATWPQFLQTLGRDRRWRVRRARRRVAEAHRQRFFVWQDAARLDEAVDRLVELHHLRWAAAGGSESFGSAAYLEFHRSIIKSFFGRRWLRLYCLEIDGAIGAMLYCYRFRNRVYLMQAGFDPKLSRLSVGNVLLGHTLEHAIGEGNAAFDFLRGEHRYKDELATTHRETICLRAFASSPGAWAYRLRRFWLPKLKARLLRRAPPTLKP